MRAGSDGDRLPINHRAALASPCFPTPRADLKIYIANRALLTVLGTTVDYQEDALSSGFVFENPNAKSLCGCGESFAV